MRVDRPEKVQAAWRLDRGRQATTFWLHLCRVVHQSLAECWAMLRGPGRDALFSLPPQVPGGEAAAYGGAAAAEAHAATGRLPRLEQVPQPPAGAGHRAPGATLKHPVRQFRLTGFAVGTAR